MPKISILLSAHNAMDTLSQAMESLIAQSFVDWECLAVEDGSNDTTRTLLSAFAIRDSRIRLITHEYPHGLTLSLIEAARLATGEYLARQDADDWSEPNRFTRQVEMLMRYSDCVGVGSSMSVHWANGEFLDTVIAPTRPESLRRMLSRRNPLAHGSLLLRREAFDRVGGYRAEFKYAQDYDLLLRLIEAGALRANAEVLYHHRLSPSGIGRSRRVQQAAYADLARSAAQLRTSGQSDRTVLQAFREPSADTPDNGIDAILVHLVKSGKKAEATERLALWKPGDYRGKAMKWLLAGLNTTPLPVRRFVWCVYRSWQHR